MSVQIVISGNRILAHGSDFAVTGDTVICASSGRVYNNATIATVDSVPDDIDSVGYEYHAGRFVPVGPFGSGTGNVAVLCSEDCKALKDSGISIDSVTESEYTTYSTTNGSVSLTFNIYPDIVLIGYLKGTSSTFYGCAMIIGKQIIGAEITDGDTTTASVSRSGNTVSWSAATDSRNLCTMKGYTYAAYALQIRRGKE